jgi:uncharacterized repeat protein (TIGR03803 family)
MKRHTLIIVAIILLKIVLINSKCNAQCVILHDFPSLINSGYPASGLLYDKGFLYGTTSTGGPNNMGTIFKVKPDGTEYSTLLEFNGVNGNLPNNSLISDGIYLYGMADSGGTNNFGVIYKIKLDGTDYFKLLDFSYSDGMFPQCSLIFDGTFLYGMTSQGGASANGCACGTIFKIKPDGTGYTKLHDFNGTEGQYPLGSLYFDGVFLYGTAHAGGSIVSSRYGTIFKIKPDGTEFITLIDFNGTNGQYPNGTLISDGTFLYGTTHEGGKNGGGVIFKIKPDGTESVDIVSFPSLLKGANPPNPSPLYFDGSFLYGLTGNGGKYGYGTIFKIKPDGTGAVNLFDFNGINGKWVGSTLVSDSTFLYGTSGQGGRNDFGTIYKIKLDGTNFNNILSFNGINKNDSLNSSLISDGTFLYGVTSDGGINNMGTIFKIKPDGTNYSKLLDFNGTNGNNPTESLIFDGMFLYGMASSGGINNMGTIFKIKSDGTSYSKLLDFNGTNGMFPCNSLISDGTFLYGTTSAGGVNNSNSYGTIFKIKLDGTGYVKLISFDGSNGNNPVSSLIYDGVFLYGMTKYGGTNGYGTIFKIKPDGTIFDTVLNFQGINGRFPSGSLIFDGTFLYGMTSDGGINNMGAAFKIKPDGTNYSKLLDFNGINGSKPSSVTIC